MVKLTRAQRLRLPARDKACPMNPIGKDYPINDPSHVASAKSYYRRRYTAKCPRGKVRICARAKRFGMLKKGYPGSTDWRRWCARV